jgi:Cd2+/Zn2+-exporting ATPase/Cu+-exporting ATPase
MEKLVEIPIQGMDCADCTRHVQQAIAGVRGVSQVEVYLAAEKAVVRLDPQLAGLPEIQKAVQQAGYTAGEPDKAASLSRSGAAFTRQVLFLLGAVFALVLFVIVVGEWLGLFEAVAARVPWPVSLAAVLALGYPVFKNVLLAAMQRRVISHTLMTAGVLAAIAVGEWATAVVVVLFMRAGDYAERFTTEKARRAVRDLEKLAPETARLLREGVEESVPLNQVQAGDIVVVRPGEKIPVDGLVVAGQAVVDQASITGESMPVDCGPGSKVYAATIISLGSLRVRTTGVGAETTFGRVIRLVEEAEAHRARVQTIADKFSTYYLPVVAGIALLTFLIRRDALAAAAVLVVACSCSFALATPIAMLASTGAAARRGLMLKGGKYLEILDRAEVVLLDKTGTLTLGKPVITRIIAAGEPDAPANGNLSPMQRELLGLAASAERYSEHPLAGAVRAAAAQYGIGLLDPQDFQPQPGIGVQARIDGRLVAVGRAVMPAGVSGPEAGGIEFLPLFELASDLEAQGKTTLLVQVDAKPAGLLAAEDTLRPEVPASLLQLFELGIRQVELLTGDTQQSAAALVEAVAAQSGRQISYRAGLLPDDKIEIVRQYQAQGKTVVMIGDGVNDAPALAQADVGIAMGAAGSDIAIEAAHVALMSDNWALVPEVFRIARRTMRVVRANIAFTAVYNLLGLTLAALGFLPPILAAAAQSLPDLGILANSSRLLRK